MQVVRGEEPPGKDRMMVQGGQWAPSEVGGVRLP